MLCDSPSIGIRLPAWIVGCVVVALAVVHTAQAQQVTFTFDGADDGLATVNQVDPPTGLSLTVDSFNGPGVSVVVPAPDRLTFGDLAGGFPTSANFTLNQDVRLVSYDLIEDGVGASFDLVQGDVESLDNDAETAGTGIAFSNGSDVFVANQAIVFTSTDIMGEEFGLNNLTFEIVVANAAIYNAVNTASVIDHSLYVSTIGDHIRSRAYLGPDSISVCQTVAASESSAGEPELQYCCSEQMLNWTGWVQGYGYDGNINGDVATPEVNYDTGTIMAGLERWLDSETMLGVSFGHSQTDIGIDTAAASANFDTFRVSAYGLKRLNANYLLGILTYGHADHEVTRIDTGSASGNFDGDQFSTYLEVGRNVELGSAVLQPLGAIQYAHIDHEPFRETGEGVLLNAQELNADSLRLSVGLRALWNASFIQPYVETRYTAETAEDGVVLGANSISSGANAISNEVDLGRHFVDAEAGFGVQVTERVRISGAYDGRFSNNSEIHGGRGRLEVSF